VEPDSLIPEPIQVSARHEFIRDSRHYCSRLWSGYCLGAAHETAGQGDKAVTAHKKAIEINPYYRLNFKVLGGADFKMGRLEEALRPGRHGQPRALRCPSSQLKISGPAGHHSTTPC
jgi:tetratricopeptide (TPR) repeat protein